MSRKPPKTIHIAILIRMSHLSGRDIFYGFYRYAHQRPNWQIHLVNVLDGKTLSSLRRLAARGLDGILVNGISFPEIGNFLKDLAIPTVILGARTPELGRRRQALTFVRSDAVGAGRLTAQHFLSLGSFRSYGFVGSGHPSYVSTLRLEGFRRELQANGITPAIFDRLSDTGDDECSALAAWLSELPKPAAIQAVHDQRALLVLEAAAEAGLAVPREVSVLGVDNDSLICEFAKPSLSSLAIDHIHIGEIMARELDLLLADPSRNRVKTVKVSGGRIIERDSTHTTTPSSKLVEDALALIRKHAKRDINAEALALRLGVSRSLLDLRFRQATGTSIHETILTTRLNEVKRLLRETSTPIGRITGACGFTSENHVKNLFRKRFGCSMSDYRNSSRVGDLTR